MFIIPENHTLISIIPDNTETYFIPNDERVNRIFRRTAIGFLQYNKKGYENCLCSVYLDEDGESWIKTSGSGQVVDRAYDSFTVGVPKILGEVHHIRNAYNPEDVLPLVKTLKTIYGITFRKPSHKTITINVTIDRTDHFGLENISEDVDDIPYGNDFGIYDKDYCFHNPEEIVCIGKWLGFFRYAFDMPDLRYDLRFDRTFEFTPEEWNKDMVNNGYPSYDEQRRLDAENEASFKEVWEKTIHAEADRFYSSVLA